MAAVNVVKRKKENDAVMERETDGIADFKLLELLQEAQNGNKLFLLGRNRLSSKAAVAIVTREPFQASAETVNSLLHQSSLQQTFKNDIYKKYVGFPPVEHARITVDLIDPASDKHISKYSKQRSVAVIETQEMYKAATLRYIEALPQSAIQWVYNIIDKGDEPERKIYEDSDHEIGFLMQTDLKWEQEKVEQLHCLAIVKRKDLRSIRDLRQEHIPLLHNIVKAGGRAIEEAFDVGADQLRIFLHYLPSYWHLHVHFVHLAQEPSHAMLIGRAHDIHQVISNLALASDYYVKAALYLVLGEKDSLAALLKDNDGIKQIREGA